MSNLIEVSAGRKTKEISLPSYEGSKLTVYEELSVGEQRQLNKQYPQDGSQSTEKRMAYMVACYVALIKEWNLGHEGKTLEINEQNIDKYFYKDDMIMLNSIMAGISYDEAKKKTEEEIKKMIDDKKKENS